MFTILLILHIAAAVLFIGPVMVSTSAFGKQALAASTGDARAEGVATNLHGITKVYGWLSALVPVFGIILLFSFWDSFSSSYNFHAALALGVIAWIILLAVIIPKQKKTVAALGANDSTFDLAKAKKHSAMFGGIFNLLWIITFILMFF